MGLKIERRINGVIAGDKEVFEREKHNEQAEALLRRVMRRRENNKA